MPALVQMSRLEAPVRLERNLRYSLYPYHKIYKVEAVGLRSSSYTYKFMSFVNM